MYCCLTVKYTSGLILYFSIYLKEVNELIHIFLKEV